MCNKLHRENDFMEIPEEGFALKTFKIQYEVKNYNAPTLKDKIVISDGKYGILGTSYALGHDDEWTKWDDNYVTPYDPGPENEFGFCFFFSQDKKIIEKIFYTYWGDLEPRYEYKYNNFFEVKRIEYRGGMGEFAEYHFIGEDYPVRMALCKEFRIMEV